jgi:hypothetical protein
VDRRNHRRLAGFFQDVLAFGGEQEFDELLHRILRILGRARHGGRVLDCRNQDRSLILTFRNLRRLANESVSRVWR